MPALTDLFVRLGVDSRELIEGFSKVNEAFDGFRRHAEQANAGIVASLSSVSQEFTHVGGLLTAAVAAPIIGIAAESFHAAEKFEEAFRTIRRQTGETGESLHELEASFRNVFVSAPGSAAAVSEAISALHQRFGLVGPDLESMSRQVLQLAKVTGSELKPLVETTARVFGDWRITTEQQGRALDFLFKVTQQTGIDINRLGQLVQQFGAPLREMGFGFEQAAVLLGKFEKEGVNTEAVMMAMKTAVRLFAEEGITNTAAALSQLITKIHDADERTAVLTAKQYFGGRAAAYLTAAIRENRFAYEDLLRVVSQSDETIGSAQKSTRSITDRFTELKKQVDVLLEPLGKILVTALEDLTDRLKVGLLPRLTALGRSFQELTPQMRTFSAWITGLGVAAPLAVVGLGLLAGAIVKIAGAAELIAGSFLVEGLGFALMNISAALQLGLVGALTAAETALLAFGYAAVAAAAVFTGWKLGEWAARNFPAFTRGVNDAMDALSASSPAFDAVFGTLEKFGRWLGHDKNAVASLEHTVAGLEAALKKKGIVVEHTGLSLEEYSKKLRAAAQAADVHSSATGRMGGAAGHAGDDVDALGGKAKKTLEHFDALKNGFLEWVQIMRTTTADQARFREAQQAITEGAAENSRRFSEGRAPLRDLGILFVNLRQAAMETATEVAGGMENLVRAIHKIALAAPVAKDALLDMLSRPVKSIQDITDAFEKLGIKTSTEVKKTAEEEIAAYERIRNSGIATPREILEAEIKMHEARIRLAREAASILTGIDRDRAEGDIRRQEQEVDADRKALEKIVGHTKGAARSIGREVSTVLTDLSRGIADAILGAKSLGDVFARVARDIVAAILRVIIQEGIIKLLEWLKVLKRDAGGLIDVFATLGAILRRIGEAIGVVHKNLVAVGSIGSGSSGGIWGAIKGALGGIAIVLTGGAAAPGVVSSGAFGLSPGMDEFAMASAGASSAGLQLHIGELHLHGSAKQKDVEEFASALVRNLYARGVRPGR